MWATVKDAAPIISSIATTLAFVAVAIQLWLTRRQSAVDAHQAWLKSERDIWLAALQNDRIAPNLMKAA